MLSVDFDRLNKWLTLAANIGVLVGIALLVVEVRQNQEILEFDQVLSIQDSADREVDRYTELRMLRIQDKEVAQVWIDGMAGGELDQVDYRRFRDMCQSSIWANTLMYDRSIALGRHITAQGTAESMRRSIDQNPGYAECWKDQRERLKTFWGYSGFVEAVELK
jgi:hypothetical protein